MAEMTPEEKNIVQWVYASKDEGELAQRYDQWAKSYDTDLDADFGWIGPRVAVDVAVKYLAREARILDAGAGTGLVGELLHGRGYTNLVAIDLSEGMLQVAGEKNVYGELHQMVMGETLDFRSNAFDGVVSVGVFTVGHAPAKSLDELVRVTKSGGYVIFGLRPDVYDENGFKEKQDELQARNIWQLVEVTDPVAVLPKGEPEVLHQVWVYRVT